MIKEKPQLTGQECRGVLIVVSPYFASSINEELFGVIITPATGMHTDRASLKKRMNEK